MRFTPGIRPEPYVETNRKRSAFLRKQRLERERFPLLAPIIADSQHSVDEEMRRRAESWTHWQSDNRTRRARSWREGRRRLFAMGGNMRAVIRQLWRSCPYPKSPEYFLDLLHGIEVGRVDPASPPWRYPRETA